MILILGTTLDLLPNNTVFIQLFIFLVIAAILSFLVFKPILKILDERRRQTEELTHRAEVYEAEADDMNREYDAKLETARHEGERAQREIIESAQTKAQKIIASAKQDDKQASTQRRNYIQKESGRIENDLIKKTDEYSELIIEKIIGKNAQ